MEGRKRVDLRVVMDSPRKGCLYIEVKTAAGPETSGRFYEEIVKNTGDKKLHSVIIDITAEQTGTDGFLAYGLICGIEEFRDKTLKIALISKEDTPLENYFRETMAVNRGISFRRLDTFDQALEWVG